MPIEESSLVNALSDVLCCYMSISVVLPTFCLHEIHQMNASMILAAFLACDSQVFFNLLYFEIFFWCFNSVLWGRITKHMLSQTLENWRSIILAGAKCVWAIIARGIENQVKGGLKAKRKVSRSSVFSCRISPDLTRSQCWKQSAFLPFASTPHNSNSQSVVSGLLGVPKTFSGWPWGLPFSYHRSV